LKAVVQRVVSARVVIDGREHSRIGKGLLVLLGVEKGDGPEDLHYIVRKIATMRIFEDDAGKMNLPVSEAGGEIMLVSQFTLAADCRKGNRPSFDGAEEPVRAKEMYEEAAGRFRAAGIPVRTGEFGASMQVHLVNDGPVTIVIERKAGPRTTD